MEYRFNENNFTDEVIKSDVPVMIRRVVRSLPHDVTRCRGVR